MEVSHEPHKIQEAPSPLSRTPRFFCALGVALMALPLLLAPTHPVAVYGYLVDTYVLHSLETVQNFDEELSDFLISQRQVARYRAELREDLVDVRGGRLFAIVRAVDGALYHHPIRTWNSFLPDQLPASLCGWLDRKEIPYLGDAVDLWLNNRKIVAMGHYHAFGGGPSPGDHRAQSLSRYAEIVVSNGVVPMVYVHGNVLPYGRDVVVSNEVFRGLRALEKGLLMEVKDVPMSFTRPSPGLVSILAFLRDYRDIDPSTRVSVADELGRLCLEFKQDYRYVFVDGYVPDVYAEDPDKAALLRNLMNVELWASTFGGETGKAYARRLALRPRLTVEPVQRQEELTKTMAGEEKARTS